MNVGDRYVARDPYKIKRYGYPPEIHILRVGSVLITTKGSNNCTYSWPSEKSLNKYYVLAEEQEEKEVSIVLY